MSEAVREIIAVAKAKGVRVAMPDPVEAVLRFSESLPQAISSTAQDLERGRPTEIDYLNGYVVRECEARGLPAPVNRTLHAPVKLLEQGRGGPPPANRTRLGSPTSSWRGVVPPAPSLLLKPMKKSVQSRATR